MNRSQSYAALATFIIVVILLLVFSATHLTVPSERPVWPPHHEVDITMVETDEEFVEVTDLPPADVVDTQEPSDALNDEPLVNEAQPAPDPGHSTVNSGPVGDAPSTTTSKLPSPIQAETKPAKPSGPAVEQPTPEELARRQASAEMSNAFANANGKNNAQVGTADNGKTGSPTGKTDGTRGTAQGKGIGGGWHMPNYRSVASSVTGSIDFKVDIDINGKPVEIKNIGGTAPAATNEQVIENCKKEIRSKNFTRDKGSDAPPTATAYITYIFK